MSEDLDYYYVIGGDDALVVNIADFGFFASLSICEDSEIAYSVVAASSPLSYDHSRAQLIIQSTDWTLGEFTRDA